MIEKERNILDFDSPFSLHHRHHFPSTVLDVIQTLPRFVSTHVHTRTHILDTYWQQLTKYVRKFVEIAKNYVNIAYDASTYCISNWWRHATITPRSVGRSITGKLRTSSKLRARLARVATVAIWPRVEEVRCLRDDEAPDLRPCALLTSRLNSSIRWFTPRDIAAQSSCVRSSDPSTCSDVCALIRGKHGGGRGRAPGRQVRLRLSGCHLLRHRQCRRMRWRWDRDESLRTDLPATRQPRQGALRQTEGGRVAGSVRQAQGEWDSHFWQIVLLSILTRYKFLSFFSIRTEHTRVARKTVLRKHRYLDKNICFVSLALGSIYYDRTRPAAMFTFRRARHRSPCRRSSFEVMSMVSGP